MSFLLWQRDGDARVGSARLVLRAAEVPLLHDAQQLCQRLQQLRAGETERIAAAVQEGRDQGHAEGFEAGRRAASDELAATLTALAHTSAAERERLHSGAGALALQVVRKLLGQFADDAVLVALADTAVCDLLPARPLALVVHPDQLNPVRARLAAGADATDGSASALRCEVRADPSCAPGACRLETEHGSVDASLDAQLARLAAAWGVADTGAVG